MWRRRKRKKLWRRPELSEDQILTWADAFHRLQGGWPNRDSGVIRGAWSEKWSGINAALVKGLRGLPGGSSLARLLAARRGVRNLKALPLLTVTGILRWMDAYHKRFSTWPHHDSTPQIIPGSSGETWLGVNSAMRAGSRGFQRGSSLARLLAEHRGVRNIGALPPFTVTQILAWADAFHERTGEWPKQKHWREVIPGTNGETWGYVILAVVQGNRGLPGGSTLFDLLAEHRGVRNVGNLPPLTVLQILQWADAFLDAHGKWPTCRCVDQTITGTCGERWFNVDQALRKGLRGLTGGSSLSKLIARHRGVR